MRYMGKCLAHFFFSLFRKRMCIAGVELQTGADMICVICQCEIIPNWPFYYAPHPPQKSL